MTRLKLYTGGGVSLSPVNAEGRTVSSYVRLVADEGKILKKGEATASCVDVKLTDVENWTEVDEEDTPEDIDDSEALSIILGGAE